MLSVIVEADQLVRKESERSNEDYFLPVFINTHNKYFEVPVHFYHARKDEKVGRREKFHLH